MLIVDDNLLSKIEPSDVWQVMLNKQILSSLRRWIENQSANSCNPSSRCDATIPYVWPISQQMIDASADVKNTETRESVLNLLAMQGIFASGERRDLTTLLRRLRSIGKLDAMDDIVQQPHANITADDIRVAALDHCVRHFQPKLFYQLIVHQSVELKDRPLWMTWISEYRSWLRNPDDVEGFLELCRLNNTYLCGETEPPEDFWVQHPFVALFFHLMGHYPPSSDVTQKAMATLPLLEHVYDSGQDKAVSVYQLLDGQVPINISHFFHWRYSRDMELFPHFSHQASFLHIN